MTAPDPAKRYEWRLRLLEAEPAAPRVRRLIFTAEHLDELHYQPGQALVLSMPLPEGGTGRRDYTIRWLDRAAGRLAIDFVLHGDTPAASWARGARPGDELTAMGPRGRIVVREAADWHLFCLDDTGLPAFTHMLEAMPADAVGHAFIEVANQAEELALATAASVDVTWLHRGAIPAGPNALILERLRSFAPPAGQGQAYLMGETSNVRSWRHHLVASGLPKTGIASEGYWRPGRQGGHDHVDD